MTTLRLAFGGEGSRPVRAMPRHAHRYPILIWYTRGRGRLTFDDRSSVAFRRGTLACIPAGVHYGEDSANGFISLYLAVEGLDLARPCVLPPEDDPRYGLAARMVLEEIRRSPVDRAALGAALTALERALRRRLSPAAPGDHLAAERELIALHAADPEFSAARLAARLGLSARALRKRFRQGAGTTAARALLSARMALAERLLASSGFPIQEVAARAGFRDPFYFARAFRRHAGLAPSAYRAQHGAEGA